MKYILIQKYRREFWCMLWFSFLTYKRVSSLNFISCRTCHKEPSRSQMERAIMATSTTTLQSNWTVWLQVARRQPIRNHQPQRMLGKRASYPPMAAVLLPIKRKKNLLSLYNTRYKISCDHKYIFIPSHLANLTDISYICNSLKS